MSMQAESARGCGWCGVGGAVRSLYVRMFDALLVPCTVHFLAECHFCCVIA